MKTKPIVTVKKYRLKKDRDWFPRAFMQPFKLKAGEVCEYFGHSDTYLFESRDGYVPFYDRFFVESRTDLFEPI